jgi:hydrophobe/amphiphile efflux-3 (HAE3) family protein
VVVVALLAAAGGVLALQLRPSADPDTLVSRGAESFRATDRYHKRFGDDAVLIFAKEHLPDLVLTSDVERLVGLEGCISGNVPQGSQPQGGPGSPCARFARLKPVKVVYGPGTFLNEAVRQIQDQFAGQQRQEQEQEKRAANAAQKLAEAQGQSKADQKKIATEARRLVQTQFVRDTLQLALQYGIRSLPRLNDPNFISTIVFDPARGADVPKARFAYLFPNSSGALIQVRLRPELSDSQRRQAIALIRDATSMPRYKLPHGGTYTVTGAPVVLAELTHSITRSIVVLLFAALLVMAAALALVFRTRLRLLPLAVALAAAGLTFGAMKLAGASLTMASVAVLPVLIGLAVDYAIQLQSRFNEEARGSPGSARAAASRAASLGGPTIAAAGAATVVGFLVLLLSPVPMVRGFGVLLVIGIGLGFACALTAGFAALTLAHDGAEPLPAPLRRAGAAVGPPLRGARELLAEAVRGALDLTRGNRATRALTPPLRAAGRQARHAWERALLFARTRPARVLAVAFALAAIGLAVDTQTKVVSDVQKLVPQDLGALRDLETLQKATGVSGEIDVTVTARDLTDPKVIQWMTDYQQKLLNHFGYTSRKGCGKAKLCPALSLPDLFSSSGSAGDQQRIRALLDSVPAYFSQAVITRDRRLATMAFGIRLMPLDEQQRVIDDMRSRLHPPKGVKATLAGLPVLAAEANQKVSAQWRRVLTLVVGLLGVALVLLAIFRDVQRALVPLIPIVLASGWSALVLFLIRIPLNPMSVTLGALVIAITTEFSVLLSERYRQERMAGASPDEALARTYRLTGAAVLASGTTAIAGFAVLAASNIQMLRDFGVTTLVDLSVSLLGVMLVLPAVLVLAERGELLALPSRAWRRARRAAPWSRRPRAAA